VYNGLDATESTMVECLKKGEVIIREKQKFSDFMGNVFVTNNITYPIKRHGQIVGAIELSQDITSVGDLRRTEKNVVKKAAAERNISRGRTSWDDIITRSPELISCIETAKIFAQSNDPVMIYGETGTGKELFVEAMVNENSERRDKYVVQNCAAIPESLFESILFGSTKGAFTGAENKKGLFEIADGGILFLDELNSMPLHLQPKLLRVIQDGKVRPIGSRIEKKVDVKVIVAMNKPPMELIKSHQLREDLFYRLSSGMINLTPLRDRKEDILLYVRHFMAEFNEKYHKNVKGISKDMKESLLQYDWPGNVRELKNVLDLSIKISSEDTLTSNDLPLYMKEARQLSIDAGQPDDTSGQRSVLTRRTLKEVVESAEKECIKNALVYCDGNVTKVAEMLGLPRQTLKFRMDKLHIQNPKKR
ncbi:MAG: sigma 54-interacting transcriptional regulator, partial [Firmicutes bacterium]|nr:sigma 54-interacting transcriptional regulator [Bacillota bacterium]